MYIVIDAGYRIYRVEKLSEELTKLAIDGEISIIDRFTMQGINCDGTWTDIQDLPDDINELIVEEQI